MTRLVALLVLAACSAPPDDTAARMAALEAQADRAEIALLRVELHEARKPHHEWAVTVVNGETLTYCLHCGAKYRTHRAIGGGR